MLVRLAGVRGAVSIVYGELRAVKSRAGVEVLYSARPGHNEISTRSAHS